MGFAAVVLASMMLASDLSPVGADDVPAAGPPTTAPVVAKFTVQVVGRVKNPGTYQLEAGARLSDALNKAGAYSVEALVARLGGTPLVDRDCEPGGARLPYVFLVHTSREAPNSGPGYMVDVAMARQKHDLRFDPLLQPNDKIYVPECRSMLQRPYPVPPIAPNYGR
jgi:protein involved in polysaccharide export with SLBB domain